jgi:ArsR family transcriptional regulator, arsenate/arsenite/antimonite-responsive transcriptional repressor
MEEYIKIFKALSDETRLRILRLLAITDEPLCVCEIVDVLGEPQYQISKHLSILKNAGLVKSKPKGTWVYYSPIIEKNTINSYLFIIFKISMHDETFTNDSENLEERLAQRSTQCETTPIKQKELVQ